MSSPQPIAAAIAEPSFGSVVGWERVEASGRAALVRVTLAPGGLSASDAQLVAVDGDRTLRCAALPSPAPAGASTLTVGFAMPATATPLGLVLGGRSFALAEPDDGRRDIERRLRAARARLAESRRAGELLGARLAVADGECASLKARLTESEAACAAVQARLSQSRSEFALVETRLEAAVTARAASERARDEALHGAARAEAAAHDASARAESLERRLSTADRRAPRGSRQAAAALCALAPAALLVAILAWPARESGKGHSVGAVPAASASATRPSPRAKPALDPLAARLKIPLEYLTLYRRAGTSYGLDWTRLAAIGAIESHHGQAALAGVASGANDQGASGPAQFLPGTWERFGVDGDGDGDRDPHSPADAIHAMASYLRASGAPQDWRSALRTYNHSENYVTSVEKLAASLRGDARR